MQSVMQTNSLTSFISNLITNYSNRKRQIHALDIQDLSEIEQEEFALRLFLKDECCMDFLLDDPFRVGKLLTDYIRNPSVDTAIEMAHEIRDLLVKNYSKAMQRTIDQQI